MGAISHSDPSAPSNPDISPEAREIQNVGRDIIDWLVRKNEQYGSSAFDPVRIFAKDVDTEAQIRVRLDDKISRLARGNASMESDEDTIKDIIGYGIIWLALKRLQDVDR